MLTLTQITRTDHHLNVLDHVNLTYRDPYGVYGLLGRNGAGKTTLFRIISQWITQYDGQVCLDEAQIDKDGIALSEIYYSDGALSKSHGVFNRSVMKQLPYFEALYPRFDKAFVLELMTHFEIDVSTRVDKLSTGKRTLACHLLALATRTKVTLFDEPMNGLDSLNRQQFFEVMMTDYAAHPRLFILSTHLIEEVENYLTHVMILKEGQIILDAPLTEIQEKALVIHNGHISGKRTLFEKSFGSQATQFIFDTLTEDERTKLLNAHAHIESASLQALFNALMEE